MLMSTTNDDVVVFVVEFSKILKNKAKIRFIMPCFQAIRIGQQQLCVVIAANSKTLF